MKSPLEARVEAYLPRARSLARSMTRDESGDPRRLRQAFDDNLAAALGGLAYAARCYDPTRGRTFETFAYLCCRSAILDAWNRAAHRPDPIPIDDLDAGDLAASSEPVGWDVEYADWVDGLARKLPPRHGELIRMHYLVAEAAEMRRCGEIMGLRPGRTSQIHTEAIELLRESLRHRRD